MLYIESQRLTHQVRRHSDSESVEVGRGCTSVWVIKPVDQPPQSDQIIDEVLAHLVTADTADMCLLGSKRAGSA